ncbi:MAG UNVERIFIED_CONTAM: hypothetical protein LVT10_23230 [Anaerolineae bacterium]
MAYQLTGRLSGAPAPPDGIPPVASGAHPHPARTAVPARKRPDGASRGRSCAPSQGIPGSVKGVHVLADGRFLSWCGGV